MRAAAELLTQLGGDPAASLYGVEIDRGSFQRTLRELAEVHGLDATHFVLGDIFQIQSGEPIPPLDAVIGNPPFIRYQVFNGSRRALALGRAAQAGVKLPALTSSWAPFLVHVCTFLKPGGRLAMVAPAELQHAAYAHPVLVHLARRFRRALILTFRHKLFPELNQDAVLVLGEGYGAPPEGLMMQHLESAESLPNDGGFSWRDSRPLDLGKVVTGHERVRFYYLDPEIAALYSSLRTHGTVIRLGELGSVGIGYVTGDNDFFHLSLAVARERGIPSRFLSRAVRRSNELVGLRFMSRDWWTAARRGEKNLLLLLSGAEARLPKAVLEYLTDGERSGVPLRYKCRVRKPWYAVPHVRSGDLFLTYMSHRGPRLVANIAHAVATNTLHIVQLHGSTRRNPSAVAACWYTSLTMLSGELEGHHLGGGMLKLEPGEAEKCVLVAPVDEGVRSAAVSLAPIIDRALREGGLDEAVRLGDQHLLKSVLGLSDHDCRKLRKGWLALRARRLALATASDAKRYSASY